MIMGNIITKDASTGITLEGTTTTGNLLMGNTITDIVGIGSKLQSPIGAGIYIDFAQTNYIMGNTVTNNGAAGLYLFNHALGNLATGNTFTGNGYGIFLFNSAGNYNSLRTARNNNKGNKTADIREYTGPATAQTGLPPTTPSGPVHRGRGR